MENSYLRNTALNSHQFLRQIEFLLTKENQIDFVSHFKSGPVDSSWSLRNQRSQIHQSQCLMHFNERHFENRFGLVIPRETN